MRENKKSQYITPSNGLTKATLGCNIISRQELLHQALERKEDVPMDDFEFEFERNVLIELVSIGVIDEQIMNMTLNILMSQRSIDENNEKVA